MDTSCALACAFSNAVWRYHSNSDLRDGVMILSSLISTLLSFISPVISTTTVPVFSTQSDIYIYSPALALITNFLRASWSFLYLSYIAFISPIFQNIDIGYGLKSYSKGLASYRSLKEFIAFSVVESRLL